MTEDQQEEQIAAEQHQPAGPEPLPWFHARDGWSFARRPDGCVSIDSPAGQVTLDAGTWASIVAAVGARGETADTHTAVARFHAGIGFLTDGLSDEDAERLSQ